MVLEVLSQLFHRGHVGEKDALDNSFLDGLDLSCREFSAEKIVIRDVEELDSLGCMEIFLNVFLTVHLTYGRLGYDVVPVVEAIMLDIVAQSSYQQ